MMQHIKEEVFLDVANNWQIWEAFTWIQAFVYLLV